jgi:Uma2 family endonuclease
MATITPMQPATNSLISESVESPEQLYRMTVDEYERIGPLLKSEKVELIDGLLVKKMTKNSPHEICCVLVHEVLATIAGWHRRAGAPIRIPKHNYPEPDISLVRGSARDYTGHPGPADVALVIEVADTTLAKDRRRVRIYGAAGIAIYWIINLMDRQIEVYSGPIPAGYSSRVDFTAGQNVPVVIDGVQVGTIAVNDMLP